MLYTTFLRTAIICIPVRLKFIAYRTGLFSCRFMENKSPVRPKISGTCHQATYSYGSLKFHVHVAVSLSCMTSIDLINTYANNKGESTLSISISMFNNGCACNKRWNIDINTDGWRVINFATPHNPLRTYVEIIDETLWKYSIMIIY